MAAITVVTEDTTGAMEAPLGAEPAAGEEVDGAVVAAASVGAVVAEAPHLEPGRLPDSAAQGDDEDNQQQPSKLI